LDMSYFDELRGRQPPDKLYHYTSVQGIEGIIRSRAVWATVVHYLNDAQEFRHAFGVARSVIHGKRSTADGEVADLLSHFGDSLERIEHVRICVFSLTEQGDLLSQWRGYCPPSGGYSIAFSPDFLTPFLEKHRFFLAPCTYDDVDHQKLVQEVIDEVVQGVQGLRKTTGASLDELKEKMLPVFFFRFAQVAPIIKHPSFAEEREWRLVSGLVADNDPLLKHRGGRSMLIPYYDLPLQDSAHPFTIADIVVGPTPHQYIATDALVGLLKQQGLKWLAVTPSRIPYREI